MKIYFKKIAITLVFIPLVGCSTMSGDVYQMGADTYSVSGGASGHGNIPKNDLRARDSAYQAAQSHCSKMSKTMMIVTEQFTSSYAGSTMNLAFRCLDSNDSELKQRPTYNTK